MYAGSSPAFPTKNSQELHNSALVKLVIMPPCHGGVHGFESRTHCKEILLSANGLGDRILSPGIRVRLPIGVQWESIVGGL